MRPLLWFLLLSFPHAAFAQADAAAPGVVTVQVTPKPANTFVASQALGAGVDGLEEGDVAKVYTPANLRAMKSAGWGALSYRLRTELAVEAWHWNPAGTWSEGAKKQGYWTSQASAPTPLQECYGYRLPRRGDTVDQAGNDGYSRLDDGDGGTVWKSNPYLDRHFTGEDNAKHPQWVLINFGRELPVNTIQIDWADPYAVRYVVQYWVGPSQDEDPRSILETFHGGTWQAFPGGTVTAGRGGLIRLRLAPSSIPVRYVRVWMTAGEGRPKDAAGDARDGLGYAVHEIGLGTTDTGGRFHDLIQHAPDGKRQTQITVSSTDPWHRASDRDPDVEQPGFDRVFASGLTRGLPLLCPTGLLYDTPDNAVGLLRFLRARGYPITHMELGEEPDGQFVTPEDYGALYVQWADALHRVDPAVTLGGPSLQTTLYGCLAWPDARGDRSWMGRFLQYLRGRGRLADFGFFSFEWYPFDTVCAPSAPQLALASGLLDDTLAQLVRDGVPRRLPWLITEYGFSAFAGEAEMDWPGALLDADTTAQFLTWGGAATYFYGYEPNAPIRESLTCDTWGNLALLLSDDDRNIRQPLAAYYAARLLTQQWAQPDTDGPQALYPARSDQLLVTAYALHRPDGQWSLLLLNKDPHQAHRVRVRFLPPGGRAAAFSLPADLSQYSRVQYVWHPDGARGYASPDRPPVHLTAREDSVLLPPYSLSVLRGRVATATVP